MSRLFSMLFPARAFLRLFLLALVMAQSAQTPAAQAEAEAETNRVSAGLPPTLPMLHSPLDFFRELLAMDAAEQRKQLAGRPAEKQKLLLEKVREYINLTPNERELRLRSTELRWYLLPLMQPSVTNRAEQLARIPADIRPSVETRLAAWDQVPPELQKELLDHEAAIRHEYDARLGTNAHSLNPTSVDSRQPLETALTRWRLMPPTHRQAVLGRFERFFSLDPLEQAAALEKVSEAERRQIVHTLANFRALTPPQRAECLRALHKYAELTPEERAQFLRDAERWKLMEPDHRQAWRNLVAKLGSQPPLPPGALPVSPPPIPSQIPQRTTNGN